MEVAALVAAGGSIMYVLLIVSIAAAAIGIERLTFYHFAENNNVAFFNLLEEKLSNKNFSEVANFCHNEKNLIAKVALAGIVAAIKGENVALALDSAYISAAEKLRDKLNYLSMIVTLSPLLGLLGTIAGMIETFNIFNLQAGQPSAISGGIGAALVATAAGLIVAIFTLILHTYFAQRLDRILTKIEMSMNLILSKVGGKSETA